MSAAASIRRALALLGAASSDWRQKGPSDGSIPLHWPAAVAAAKAQLAHALSALQVGGAPRPAPLRRWDSLAVPQLCEHLARLEQENEALRRELANAEDDAEHWRENARQLAGESPGLREAGQLVRLPDADARAGMAWWNGLTEQQRAQWLRRADSACPADAWATCRAAKEVPTRKPA